MVRASLVVLSLVGADPEAEWTSAQVTAIATVEERSELIVDLGKQIWEFAELAFQEHRSSKLLAETLESAGFRVQREVAGMKTAFVAEVGEGWPVIAILAEYDALPGLSQDAVPTREPIPRRDAGHGCGHNLFGAASTGAALAVKRAIQEHSLSGTVRLYGCPAEEGGAGKVYMVREGLFEDVDAVLHWHPSTVNDASPRTSLAVIRFRVRFHGKSAHAAGSPHKGRSAMDGVELMNIGANYLREHVIQKARIHYVVTNGGLRPNVVPDTAEVWYYIRAPKMGQAQEIFERVQKIAQGASLMSGTEHHLHMLSGSYELLVNETLAGLMDGNLRQIGLPRFSEQEQRFASQLRESLGIARGTDLRSGAQGPIDQTISEFEKRLGYGSTDVGDVSWTVPTAGLRIATSAREVPGHSWSFTACSGSPMGQRGSLTAAKVLAATCVELLQRPEVLQAAQEEFRKLKTDTSYESILEDGPAPLRLDAD